MHGNINSSRQRSVLNSWSLHSVHFPQVAGNLVRVSLLSVVSLQDIPGDPLHLRGPDGSDGGGRATMADALYKGQWRGGFASEDIHKDLWRWFRGRGLPGVCPGDSP